MFEIESSEGKENKTLFISGNNYSKAIVNLS
jgi:hypothetical protein